jgi:hypothetical protein
MEKVRGFEDSSEKITKKTIQGFFASGESAGAESEMILREADRVKDNPFCLSLKRYSLCYLCVIISIYY